MCIKIPCIYHGTMADMHVSPSTFHKRTVWNQAQDLNIHLRSYVRLNTIIMSHYECKNCQQKTLTKKCATYI